MGNLEGANGDQRGKNLYSQTANQGNRNARSFGMRKVNNIEQSEFSPNPKNKRLKGAGEIFNRKKEKITIVAKNKTNSTSNEELRVMDLIQEKNPKKMDYDLIYSSIGKHFFMQTLNDQARNEIIVNMSLYKVKAGERLFTQGSMGHYWFIVHVKIKLQIAKFSLTC